MTQRGILVKIGSTVKQWEVKKRQVIKNQNSVPNGNEVETGDFDVFDSWLEKQRKFILDYLRADEHADLELDGVIEFLVEDGSSPRIQLHFSVWSSMSRSNTRVTIQRLSRLMNEYHVARMGDPHDDMARLLREYGNSLEKEQGLIRQIERARENYHRALEAYNQHDVQRVQAWEMDGNKYSKSKLVHHVNICRKTYEDILKFEAGKVRASLMRAMYALERRLIQDEERRLTQLMAVVQEYIQLLQCPADLKVDRKKILTQQSKHIGGLQKRTQEMVKSWIQDKRCPVEFPEFQDLKTEARGVKSELRRTSGMKKLVEMLRSELKALQTRFREDDIEELSPCRSSSSEEIDTSDPKLSFMGRLSPDSKTDEGDVLFRNVTEIQHHRSTEASDLDVEDVDTKGSNHILYPTVTASAREFALVNQRSKHSCRMTENMDSKGSSVTSGLAETVPGSIASDEDLRSCSRQTRQITISSSDEEVFGGELFNRSSSLNATQRDNIHFGTENKDRKLDLNLSELTGIYVVAKKHHETSHDDELVLNIGDIIKQEKPINEYGMAYGYVKKNPFGPRHYGYYPVDKVGFHRFGRKFQRKRPS